MPTREELLAAHIAYNFPQYHWMLQIPEVATLLLDAVDPNKGFSPTEFQAKLETTNWWKTTSPAARQWAALEGTDPAAANQRLAAREAELIDMAAAMGAAIPPGHAAAMARWSLTFGMGEAETRNMIAALIPATPGEAAGTGAGGGSMSETYNEIRRLAAQEYLVPLSDTDAWTWARRIQSGDASMEWATQALRDLARYKYSHMAETLDAGITPGQFFSPYRNMIAQEMEIGAEAVDLMDPKWGAVIAHTASGQAPRPMSLAEAQKHVRSQAEWQSTDRARGMSAELGNELLRTLGAIA